MAVSAHEHDSKLSNDKSDVEMYLQAFADRSTCARLSMSSNPVPAFRNTVGTLAVGKARRTTGPNRAEPMIYAHANNHGA